MHFNTYWAALASLLVVTLLNFGKLRVKSIFLTWLVAGLGGFLVAVYFSGLMGLVITALGAISLYMTAHSSSME